VKGQRDYQSKRQFLFPEIREKPLPHLLYRSAPSLLVLRHRSAKLSDMGIPYKPFTAAAAFASYLLVSYRPQYLLSSKPTYAGTFVFLWSLIFMVWGFYKVILYHRYFSPLRHLPGPSVRKKRLLWNLICFAWRWHLFRPVADADFA
jgi:hypothetical protein